MNKKSAFSSGQSEWLVTVLRFGIYVLAFIPLVIFSQFLSPFHFGKAVLFRSIVDILAVFYIVLLCRDRRYTPPQTPIFWIVTVFTIVWIITSLTGSDVSVSMWGSLERMGGLYSFIHFWMFFVMVTSIFRTKEEWIQLLNVSIFASILGAFYGFLQKTNLSWVIGSGGRSKIFGTIGNSALFAGYQVMNLFFAIMLYARRPHLGVKKYFYLTAIIVNFLAVLLSGIRGSVLGMFIALIFFIFSYSIFLGTAKVKKLAFTGVLAFMGIFALLVIFKDSAFVKSSSYLTRFTDISPQSYTVQTRFWTWQSGFEGWKESARSMFLGYGPENFNIPFSHHFNPNHFVGLTSETLFDRAHNAFLEVLVTMGIVGEFVYIALFVVIMYACIKIIIRSRTAHDQAGAREQLVLSLSVLATLIAYLIHNFFIFDTTPNYLVFFLFLGFVGLLCYENQYHQKELLPKALSKTVCYTALFVVTIAAIWSIYFWNIRPAIANYTTTRGIIFGWNQQVDQAIEKFKKAMTYDDVSIIYEIRHRFGQFIVDKAGGATISPNVVEGIGYGIEKIKLNVEKHPNDYVPLLYLSRMNIILGKDSPTSPYNDEALKYSLAALKISPTFIRTYFEIAQAYLNKKDYTSAITYFQKAVELNSKTAVSNWYLGSALTEAGRSEEGLKYLTEAIRLHYVPSEVDYLRLANIYVKGNDISNLILIYEGLIKIKPNSAQYRASLAASYAQVGNIDAAVAQAHEAARLDPKFEAEARLFVQRLGRTF